MYNKVKLDIEQSIKNRGLEDFIFEVKVPTQIITEVKVYAKQNL